MRPPFPYYGGKQSIADRIVAVLPDHDHYIEPYCGSLAVLLAKRPSILETVNDLDRHLVTFWRMLRDHPDDLCAAAALTPHSRAEHQLCNDLDVADDLERARRVWVLLTQTRGGDLRSTVKGWRFHIDPATGTGLPKYLSGYIDRMPAAAGRLATVSLECRPALEVIADYGSEPSACLYVDPPYLGTSRSSRGYRHEMAGDDDHRALAAAVADCKAAVVLSGYDGTLYDDLYADGWDRVTISSATSQGGSHQARTEVLWSNRILHTGQLDL